MLIFGARGGARMIKVEVPSIGSEEEAEQALARVKEKVANLIAEARRPDNSNGHDPPEAPVIDDDVPQPERGVRLPPLIPRSPGRRDPRGPRRKKGERLREALRILAEEGPMRQSELRLKMKSGGPEMAKLKPQLLAAGVVEGEVVDRSPMLHYTPPDPAEVGEKVGEKVVQIPPDSPNSPGAQLPSGASELQSATEPPPVAPPVGIEPMLPQLPPGPPTGELAGLTQRLRDAVAEVEAASAALLAHVSANS